MATGISINNDAWYLKVPEFMFEGYWGCRISSSDVYDKYIQSVSIPQLNLDYDVTNYGLVNFKEKVQYGEGTIEYYDDVEGTFNAFLDGWVREVFNESSNYVNSNWRGAYKTIVVEYYRMISGVRKSIVQYTLNGCYPKGISDVSTDEEAGERKTNSFSFVVQKVTPTFGDSITTIFDNSHTQLTSTSTSSSSTTTSTSLTTTSSTTTTKNSLSSLHTIRRGGI